MNTNKQALVDFEQTVWSYYHDFGRDLPWRRSEPDGSFDAYKIMVSEIMLQQTQVARVMPKYLAFISRFPSVQSLAAADQSEVLLLWSGLGYNRRARYLWLAAKEIIHRYAGHTPSELEDLIKLPGIGRNTACAVLVYSFGAPMAFIETNIRTVYMHHFFSDVESVNDKQILELVQPTLPASQFSHENREWYWALMDYGTYLKTQVGNNIKQSAHYKKQSPFKGSLRELRGQILRALATGPLTRNELELVCDNDARLAVALDSLTGDKLVMVNDSRYSL